MQNAYNQLGYNLGYNNAYIDNNNINYNAYNPYNPYNTSQYNPYNLYTQPDPPTTLPTIPNSPSLSSSSSSSSISSHHFSLHTSLNGKILSFLSLSRILRFCFGSKRGKEKSLLKEGVRVLVRKKGYKKVMKMIKRIKKENIKGKIYDEYENTYSSSASPSEPRRALEAENIKKFQEYFNSHLINIIYKHSNKKQRKNFSSFSPTRSRSNSINTVKSENSINSNISNTNISSFSGKATPHKRTIVDEYGSIRTYTSYYLNKELGLGIHLYKDPNNHIHKFTLRNFRENDGQQSAVFRCADRNCLGTGEYIISSQKFKLETPCSLPYEAHNFAVRECRQVDKKVYEEFNMRPEYSHAQIMRKGTERFVTFS